MRDDDKPAANQTTDKDQDKHITTKFDDDRLVSTTDDRYTSSQQKPGTDRNSRLDL